MRAVGALATAQELQLAAGGNQLSGRVGATAHFFSRRLWIGLVGSVPFERNVFAVFLVDPGCQILAELVCGGGDDEACSWISPQKGARPVDHRLCFADAGLAK